MAGKDQTATASEREISVDLNAADPDKAVTRRASSDIAQGARERDTDAHGRSKIEQQLFKRMGRIERNLTKQFDQQMANREAEWQRERSELQSRLEKINLDRGGDDQADAAHDAAIAALKAKLEASYEKGDSQASADITLQISKLDAQYWAKKAQAAGVTTRETAAAPTRQEAARPAPKTGPTVAGSRFIRANEDWWEDPDYAAENGACNAIYIKLVTQEGFDPKSDETFKEVAKQLKAKFPKLDVHAGRRGPDDDDDDDDDEGRREGERETRRAAAANIADRGGSGDSGHRNGNRRSLTAEDIKTMRDCRLDPDNDRDVVQFLKEAVALEAATR
jgi:hypothetical protein